ncbi:MAG TPA: hypothetical protein VHV47_02350 [Opitutaceae bacterium]|jgi:hypothetical protein|nr:hypothetical protein [Opitutaceae bacterium]
MKTWPTALLACLLAAAARGAAPVTFYVSPAGSDAGAGTLASPFRTLERARDAVRAASRDAKGDIEVHLRGGIYPLLRPIEFGPEDSGRDGHVIRYEAYEDEVPVFSGGVVVTGWTRDHGEIYRAPLARSAPLRALFIDGRRAALAQAPKAVRAAGPWGSFAIRGTERWAETPGTTLDGLRFAGSELAPCADPESVELVQRHAFNELILGVRAMRREGGETIVELQQPYGAIAASLPWGCGLDPRGTFVVRNARELLQAPGQFYFDRAQGMLYYYRDGEDLAQANVVAPSSLGLLRLRGRSKSDRVHDLVFRGIAFAYDDWPLMELAGSRGFVGVQSLGLCDRFRADGNHHEDRYQGLDLPQATVELRNCERIVFVRDRFEHLGSGSAVSLVNDVRASDVEGNLFYDLAGNAVNVGHPQHYDDHSALFPRAVWGPCTDDSVRDNRVRRCCLDFVQEEAISGFFTRGLVIAHNDIQGTPYGGIALGWWWGNAGIPPSRVPRDNVIAANRVVDTQQVLSADGGSIYVLGEQPGGQIIGNYVRGHTRLLYPDDGSAGWTIRANVAEDGLLWFHAWVGRVHGLQVEGNYTNTPEALNRATGVVLRNTHFEGQAPPWSAEAEAIIAGAGLESTYSDLR